VPILTKTSPEMMSAYWDYRVSLYFYQFYSISMNLSNWSMRLLWSLSSMIIFCIIWVINPHDIAILIAVSTLSPVNTHTLIPAFLNASIVVSTSSYNLSSIAVVPTNIKSYSIILYNSSICFSLPSYYYNVLSYSSFH